MLEGEFLNLIAKEAERRGIVADARCQFCGDYFLKQTLGYILAHSEVCPGREEN